jgi:hypothetical protein
MASHGEGMSWDAERAAARKRTREAHERKRARQDAPVRDAKPGRLAEAAVRITWLDPPVGCIVGVCSDAAPDVARQYGVKP